MNPHPDPEELRAFAERRLPPAAMLRIDSHLAGCESCRSRVAGLRPDGRAAVQAAVRGVVAAGAHLPYEQLQSYVDNKLTAAQQAAVTAHTTLCPMCRRELDDLLRHAPALRQPVAAPAAPKREGLGRLWQWLPAAAVAGFVGAVALTVVLQRNETATTDGGVHTAAQGRPDPESQLRHDALDNLAPISPIAAAAWKARDYPRLVDALRPLADQRNPVAMSALASLYAQGLGVPKDLRMAEQLWQRAADLGQPEARANSAVVRRMTAAGQ